MLRRDAEGIKPGRIKAGEVDDEDQIPVTGCDKEQGQREVPGKNGAGPGVLSHADILARHMDFMPSVVIECFISRIFGGGFDPPLDALPCGIRLREGHQLPEPEFDAVPIHFLWKDEFKIEIMVSGNLMVPHMAGTKPEWIAPTQEREKIEEKIVQGLSPKGRFVHELMHGHEAHEMTECPVQEEAG